MNLVELQERHRDELRRLDSILVELGHKTQLLEKSASVPYHALLVSLAPQARNSPMQMVLTFYPVDPGTVKHTLLLQYYLELPFIVSEAGLHRVAELLPYLNNKSVLGHFGITDGRPTLHYRYVQSLPASSPVTKEAVEDVMVLVRYTPLLFIDTLEALATGKVSLQQAQAQVDAQYTNK